MLGTGLPEIVIILLVVLLLFGPAVLTFWLGYVVGRGRASGSAPSDVTISPDATGKTPVGGERDE